ncbi:MAG TPA: GNAT family N-acetyltransferase [bacterium]|nr:GNAT family N-acetyltransferase [bacterium]
MTSQVRPARLDDVDDFLRLILMSDKAFLPSLFGEDYERVIRGIFESGEGLFGYPNVRIVEVDSRVAGMLLAYTYEQMVAAMAQWETEEEQPPAVDEPATRSGWVNPGEYYLANMAVFPEYRRNGLGSLLLADAESRARQQGCNRLALDVEAENRDAIRLYERAGFVREANDLKLMGRFQFARYSKPVSGV